MSGFHGRKIHIFIVTILVFLTLLFMNTAVVTGLSGEFSCKLVFKPFHGLHGVYQRNGRSPADGLQGQSSLVA